jgi:UDP-N-acetylglucosamine--N-acetylmuramyl-(pentapeptide) pyrophosphoryl-undecaprenol N-acetylglucosamine transferase
VKPNEQLACLIAAGGTAGHTTPALAVAEALRKQGVHVTFAGSPDRAEARLVPAAGFELDTFRISGISRKPGKAMARSLLLAARAPAACGRIIERRRPDVVLGGGGYVAGPMVYAAWRHHVPAALTEADAHFGLANRLAAPFAQRVFLAYAVDGRTGEKYRVVGRPVPHLDPVSREEGRRRFGLPAEGPVLLVFGGSQGARAVNDAALAAFGESGPTILHLCGARYEAELRPRVARSDYILLPWTDGFAGALAACDLVFARAGGSIWEVAAAGRPAVLVPSPNVTADHQTKNARYFEHGGGAVVVPEPEIDRAPEVIRSLLRDERKRDEMAKAMLALARPDAADVVAEELIALARAGR